MKLTEYAVVSSSLKKEMEKLLSKFDSNQKVTHAFLLTGTKVIANYAKPKQVNILRTQEFHFLTLLILGHFHPQSNFSTENI